VCLCATHTLTPGGPIKYANTHTFTHSFSLPLSLSLSLTHTHAPSKPTKYANTHTLFLSYSLSLSQRESVCLCATHTHTFSLCPSLSHTHTYAHITYRLKKRRGSSKRGEKGIVHRARTQPKRPQLPPRSHRSLQHLPSPMNEFVNRYRALLRIHRSLLKVQMQSTLLSICSTLSCMCTHTIDTIESKEPANASNHRALVTYCCSVMTPSYVT